MLQFLTTSDGSKTIFNSEIGENYHSRHGALQESRHVFLNSGLQYFLNSSQKKELSILEVGFGTGLNFLLSADYCQDNKISLNYTGIEAYPLSTEMVKEMGYQNFVSPTIWLSYVDKYHEALSRVVKITDHIRLGIPTSKAMDFKSDMMYDVVYFDAFASVHQPEMWDHSTLEYVSSFIKPGGIFVTYAITGNLKRSMKALGFTIEKVPGAAGKREMLRARKIP